MKYIISKNNDVIIFSDGISHRDMARDIGCIEAGDDIVGAGFVRFSVTNEDDMPGDLDIKCYGESVSLGIKSRGIDDECIIEGSNNNY